MLIFEATLVVMGTLILIVGWYYAFRVVDILRKEGIARPWVVLTVLIGVFLLGYVFIGMRFLGYDPLPEVTNESVVALVFFVGAAFVVALTYLSSRMFADIFGEELTDLEAVRRFTGYFNLHDLKLHKLLRSHSFTCEACGREIEYSIPDVVRAHPQLDRGVIVEDSMGRRRYTFYVRHRCGNDHRETPVQHDEELEYRSQRPSRVI